MLTLPIKKKWFDMIKSGEKKEEYREIKPYWTKRLFDNRGYCKYGLVSITEEIDREVLFRNGYGNNKPTIKCKVHISINSGKEEWGAEPNELYYVLKILSVEEVN